MTFALDPNTATSFKVGEKVTVHYQTATSGTVHQAVRVASAQTAVTPDNDEDTRRLPATAGTLPLIALLGLFAIGGAVALRVARA
jgi:hypothetical protein